MSGISMRCPRAAIAAVPLLVVACGSDRGVPETSRGAQRRRRDGLTKYACFANPNPRPLGGAAVTLDASSRFQTMQGFGTTERLFDDPHVTETFDQATQRAAAIPPAADQERDSRRAVRLDRTDARALPPAT